MTSQKQAAQTGAASFQSFGLPEKLLKSLDRMDFKTPTPIQAQAIPLALKGEDILGTAQTGTGKTAAFGLPAIVHLMNDDNAMAVIMTPTRELAAQVIEAMQQMIPVPNIGTALLIGGEAIPRQLRQLDKKPRLIVGTPGRINDHLVRRSLKLDRANFLVLDETDRMLDMGFGPQIETIVDKMNDKRQTLLFSATLPDNITRLSKKYLTNPKRIAVGSISEPVKNISQTTIKLAEDKKYDQLMVELEQRKGSIIIFVKTKHGADRMAKKLGGTAAAIHGDLQQRKRDRVIGDFRDKRFRILVATDVAARGLDIPHIEHVINYDMPQVPEDYIHRIGRTARAGAEGSAVNFVTPVDGRKFHAIQKLLGGDTDTQDANASRGVKRQGDRARGALPRRAGKPGGGFGRKERGDNRAPRRFNDNAPRARHEDERPQRSHKSSQNDRPRGPWSPNSDAVEFVEARSKRQERPAGGGRTAAQRAEHPKRGFRGDRNERPSGERRRPAHSDNSYTERPRHDDRPKSERGPAGEGKPKKHGGPKNRWSSARKEHAKSDRGPGKFGGGKKQFTKGKKRVG